VVPDEAVLRQADADAGEREPNAEPHAAPGAYVPNHLRPEAGAPADATADAEPHTPEGAGRRVHGVPALVPPEHALDDHPQLHGSLDKRNNASSTTSLIKDPTFFPPAEKENRRRKWWAAAEYQLGLRICCRWRGWCCAGRRRRGRGRRLVELGGVWHQRTCRCCCEEASGLLVTRGRRRPCSLPATVRGVANLIAVSSPSLVLSQPNPMRRRRGRKEEARALLFIFLGPGRFWASPSALVVVGKNIWPPGSPGGFNLKQNISMLDE
jgi:hypothetical protein